jgi:hypothetical protein
MAPAGIAVVPFTTTAWRTSARTGDSTVAVADDRAVTSDRGTIVFAGTVTSRNCARGAAGAGDDPGRSLLGLAVSPGATGAAARGALVPVVGPGAGVAAFADGAAELGAGAVAAGGLT